MNKYKFYGAVWDEALINKLYKKLHITNWVVDYVHPKDVIDCFFYYLEPKDIARNIHSFISDNKFIYEPVPSDLAEKAFIRLDKRTELSKYLIEE